ncbi:MAG: hypothetical protein K1X79_10715 [Oligoflexia bacterium]|nr:hypothetical protein [Oligoflexia bacterium]
MLQRLWSEIDIPTTRMSVGLFRILLYSVVFLEYWVVFRTAPFSIAEVDSARGTLIVLLVASACSLVGILLPLSTALTFLAIKTIQPMLFAWYEVDWVIELFSLLFLFAPHRQGLALDNVVFRRRLSPIQARAEWQERHFSLLVVLVLTLVYFDATLTKLTSELWSKGLALWYASYIPYVCAWKLPFVVESQLLLKPMTYLVTAYELLFPLILFRRFRRIFLVSGIALHLSISILLPLTFFGMLMTAALCTFLDFRSGEPGTQRSQNCASGSARLCAGVYATLLVYSFVMMKLHGNQRDALAVLLGVHPTGVYADSKFTIAPPILRLEIEDPGGRHPLPSFSPEGYPTVRDRMWKVWGFFSRARACGWQIVKRYALWRGESSCHAQHCDVLLSAKAVAVEHFEFDPTLPSTIASRPWIPLGKFSLPGGEWQEDSDPTAGAIVAAFRRGCPSS